MRRLIEYEKNLVGFHCPGCGYGHCVGVNGRTIPGSEGSLNSWTWNQKFDYPTFSPSVLVNKEKAGRFPLCHSFVKDGRIQFLSDCTHALAGQTIELEDADS